MLEQRACTAPDDKVRADYLHRVAVIQIESFNDKALGLQTLRQALDQAPDHAAARAATELTDVKELFECRILETVRRSATTRRSPRSTSASSTRPRPATGCGCGSTSQVTSRIDRATPRRRSPRSRRRSTRRPTDADVLAEIEHACTSGWKSAADARSTPRSASGTSRPTARDLWMRVAGQRKTRSATLRRRALVRDALKPDLQSDFILRGSRLSSGPPGAGARLYATLRRLAASTRRRRARRPELAPRGQGLAETVLKDAPRRGHPPPR